MTNKHNTVWIELPPPDSDDHAEQIATLANNMLARLSDKPTDHAFWWSQRDNRWCFGRPSGYEVLNGNGHWFNLDYLGRADAHKTPIQMIEEAEQILNEWLVDNTEDVFEEEPEIDEARCLLNDALEALRGEA